MFNVCQQNPPLIDKVGGFCWAICNIMMMIIMMRCPKGNAFVDKRLNLLIS